MWQVKYPCPHLGGTDVWPGKNNFHKIWTKLDNIAVYFIAFMNVNKMKKYEYLDMMIALYLMF